MRLYASVSRPTAETQLFLWVRYMLHEVNGRVGKVDSRRGRVSHSI